MSVPRALVGSMIGLVLFLGLILGAIGVHTIQQRVRGEAQERVNYSLRAIRAQYDAALRQVFRRVRSAGNELTDRGGIDIEAALRAEERADLTILNLCDTDGRPLAGSYPDLQAGMDLADDPLIAGALAGEAGSSTVLYSAERVELEAGTDLRDALAVAVSTLPGAEPRFMFLWAAWPVLDESGKVRAVVYGGRALNRDYALIDRWQHLVFAADTFEGKPVGTVTVFAEDLRVTTNVVGHDGRRAIGTVVSDPVRRHTLEGGQVWHDRAYVVDANYISAYEPIRDPADRIIGMLYVGLLEAPYAALEAQTIARLMGVMIAVMILAVLIGLVVVRRLTRPLARLSEASQELAGGNWEHPIPAEPTFTEIAELVQAFQGMRSAIADRDQRLRRQNEELHEANEQLSRVNRNYMQTLGFVTHELKSPLGAMQTIIGTILKGYTGQVTGKTAEFLRRIDRNCEELQGMVKDYLDLSRLERGELNATMRDIELRDDVVEPCVSHAQPLFDARGIDLSVSCPDRVELHADPELLRIALTNYLSNAAKYGNEDGHAELAVMADGEAVSVRVRNDGPGFTAEDRAVLFQQFSRIQNDNTKRKKGSGVGLFLCRHIIELHGGDVQADSRPGEWAEFSFRLPRDG